MRLESLSGPFEVIQVDLFPCITPITDPGNQYLVNVYLQSGKTDKTWKVSFLDVMALFWEDESYAPTGEWLRATRDRNAVIFQCYESTLLERWEQGGENGSRALAELIHKALGDSDEPAELKHYALFGENLVVQILCLDVPSISEVHEKLISFALNLRPFAQ